MKLPSFALGFTLLFSSCSLQALTFFYDPERTGEISMVKGIKAEIRNLKPDEPFHDFTDLETLSKETPRLIVTVGTAGFNLLKDARFKDWPIAHVSHQIFEDHSATIATAKAFFLPAYLKSLPLPEAFEAQQEKITWTNGVAYHLPEDKVKVAYEALPEKPEQAPRVVILGGDTQKTGHTWLPYTKEQAETLATWLAAQVDDRPIIVLNGPRTGKHNADGTVDSLAHKEGVPDHVTTTFLSKLKSDNSGLTVKVFDFQYGAISAYKGILGALLTLGGTVYVPGESNSMIQDMIALGLKSETVIYRHSAMQESHHTNVDYLKSAEGLRVLSDVFEAEPGSDRLEGSSENPNKQIAGKILALLASS